MSLDTRLLEGLPDQVVNELAILEDRALRAEGQAQRAKRREVELHDEVATLRETVTELTTYIVALQERASEEVSHAEDVLRLAVVIQARP